MTVVADADTREWAMPLEDKMLRRTVEREIAKHPIDYSLVRVLCISEVIYIDGVVKPIRGALGRGTSVQREMEKVVEAIKGMHGVKDVVADYRIE